MILIYYILVEITMSFVDKRIVTIFKTFIEKVFVPQFPKMDPGCQQEWSKFSNMISAEQVNFNELQLYVEGITTQNLSTIRNNFEKFQIKAPHFTQLRKENSGEQPGSGTGFNPSRTFGGERARVMLGLKDYDEPQDRNNNQLSKDFSKQQPQGLTTQAVLPALERLFRLFGDNHVKMEKIAVPSSGGHQIKSYYG